MEVKKPNFYLMVFCFSISISDHRPKPSKPNIAMSLSRMTTPFCQQLL